LQQDGTVSEREGGRRGEREREREKCEKQKIA
jgi:hypothetical protein